MLVLSRRENEVVRLPGLDVTFKVLSVRGGRVQIGIEAPAHFEILIGSHIVVEALFIEPVDEGHIGAEVPRGITPIGR